MPRPLALPSTARRPRFADPTDLRSDSLVHAPARLLVRRVPVLLAAAVAAVGMGAVAGCEEADPQNTAALRELTQAQGYRAAGDPQYRYRNVTPAGGDAAQALGNELAGDVAVETASIALAGDPTGADESSNLIEEQTTAIVTAERLNRLANTVIVSALVRANIEQASEGLSGVAQSLRQKASQVRGSDNWAPEGVTSEEASIPGLGQVEARIEEINRQIEEKRQQIADLENQRNDILSRASERDEVASSASGNEAASAAREVADLRIEAAGISAQLETAQGQLRRLQEDLQQQQALLSALEQAATSLQEQATTLEQSITTGPGSLQSSLANLQQRIQQIISGQGDGEQSLPTLAQLSEQLDNAINTAEQLREQALEALSSAEASYQSAAQRAQTVASRRGTGNIARGVSQSYGEQHRRILLSRAAAQRMRAEIYLGSALLDTALLRLQASGNAARDAGRPIDELTFDGAASDYATALDRASAALLDAESTVEDALSGASGDLQASALVERALIISAMLTARDIVESTAQLNTEAAEVSLGLPSANELSQAAQDVVQSAEAANVRLPALPRFDRAAGREAPAETATDTEGAATTQEADDAEGELVPQEPGSTQQ